MRRGRLICFGLASLALLGACGSKTRLWRGNPHDSGPPPPDGALDGGPPDGGGGIEVDCGRSEQFTTPRRPITLEATATSSEGIVREGWTMTSSPPGSLATNAPTDGATTTITPDATGTYTLRYDAVDGAGRTGTCEVRVQSVVGPPVALCPEEELTRTPAGVPITIFGDAFDDLGVLSIAWTQLEGPSPARLTVVGAMGGVIEFVADVPGLYVLQLEVFDTDGARDECTTQVRVTAPPSVMCPGDAIRAPTRRPVSVTASATDDSAIVSVRWEMTTRPDGSSAASAPLDAATTTFTPDRRGEYVLRFTATDDDGETASCDVTVIGTPTPPDAMCPAVIETSPLTTTDVVATAVDDGTITRWGWRVIDVPPGARPGAPTPADAPATRFRPDLAGEYTLRLTVTDDDGDTDECDTLVRAISGDGLRVEVFWDTDGTDMDTHLLRPGAPAWWSETDDCYFGNCTVGDGPPRLEWGGPTDDDDPRLDIDDTNGFGPENINIRRPGAGRYRVGVHAWSGFARVTVRIYCGGSTTEPRQTFGPVAIDGRNVWRVADVDIGAAGCTITDLASGGRPNIISEDASRTAP